jgi:hypothetical protein
LKRADVATVFRLLSRHPRLVKPIWQSLRERLARNRDEQSVADRTWLNLVLIPQDTDLPHDVTATVHPDATWVIVPPVADPGEATAAALGPLAARLSDLFCRHQLDVLAVGPEGRYALGMLPQVGRARNWPDSDH